MTKEELQARLKELQNMSDSEYEATSPHIEHRCGIWTISVGDTIKINGTIGNPDYTVKEFRNGKPVVNSNGIDMEVSIYAIASVTRNYK